MYGNQTQAETMPYELAQGAVQKTQTLGDINSESQKQLSEAVCMLDTILQTVRGAQPQKEGSNVAKMPERSVVSEARDIRRLTTEVNIRLNELARILN